MSNEIRFYGSDKPFAEFSNFSQHPILVVNQFQKLDWYPTVEHFYQSQKTENKLEAREIQQAATPGKAKRLGQKVNLVQEWDFIKYPLMLMGVLQKFLMHKDMKDLLLSTGNKEIIEDSPTDYIWGCGEDGTGENLLGKILMEVRSKIK